jgi:hypothetical protein
LGNSESHHLAAALTITGHRDCARRPWHWIAVFALAGSSAGWLGDAVWSPTTGLVIAVACAVASFMRQLFRRAHGSSTGSIKVNVLKAAGFGLAAWLLSHLIWLGIEIGLAGSVGWVIKSVVGFFVGGLGGCTVHWFAHRRANVWLEFCRLLGLGLFALALLSFCVCFFVFTGPHDFGRYPEAAKSRYRLPWTGGVTRLCIQGNRAIVSHRDGEEFAYDFAMPVGSDVCAARAGTVVEIDVEHDGDGTFGSYLHLQRGGGYVKLGQRVRQGDVIAASGNVGRSMLPHLHFDVFNNDLSLVPVTFADVDADQGIPRMFKRYTSGNYVR